MTYIGNPPLGSFTTVTSQSFDGDGSTTVFTLNKHVNSATELECFVSNVQQEPGTGKAFTASGTTLTFSEAPPSGTGNIYVIYRGLAQHVGQDENAPRLIGDNTLTGDLTVSRAETNGTVRLNLSNTGVNGSTEYSELKLNSTAGGTQTSIIQHRNNYGLNLGTTTNHAVYLLQNNATALTIDTSKNVKLSSDASDFTFTTNSLHIGDGADIKIGHTNNNNVILSDNGMPFSIYTDVFRCNSADNSENLFGATKNAGFFCKHNNNTGMSLTDSDGSGVRLNFVANMTNTNVSANNVRGVAFGKEGDIEISSISDNLPLDVNRGNDGAMIRIRSAGTAEGQISVSGSTTSYGAFTGTHWSRLTDNSKPNIPRGTVMETIDEMCDWYSVEFDMDIKYVLDADKIPEGKKVGDVKETLTVKRDIGLLPDGKSVGDTMTYTEDGVEYTGTILKQGDEKHVKTKISDTAECTNVYGVFMSWDEDDDTVNDMNVASLGTMVVRIHKDQTVSKGDLLTSNGDGTAKLQDDDIIRTKTIGKVLTNIKQETYSDGSYTVPCALYCG